MALQKKNRPMMEIKRGVRSVFLLAMTVTSLFANSVFAADGNLITKNKKFCEMAISSIMQTSVHLTESQSLLAVNNFLRDLKSEKVVDEIPLNENLVLPSISLFAAWQIRKGRTFLIHAWDLNRLLEMQTRTDVIVIGSIDQRKIELVKNALHSTGIRIFPVSLESLPNAMEELAHASDGAIIQLPGRCN